MTAPGDDILSLGARVANIGSIVGPGTYLSSGTSMAAPFVSGAIALLLNKYPGASLEFLKTKLIEGAKDLGAPGWDPYYGYGRLNISGSLGISPVKKTAVPALAKAKVTSQTFSDALQAQAVIQVQSEQRSEMNRIGTLASDNHSKEIIF